MEVVHSAATFVTVESVKGDNHLPVNEEAASVHDSTGMDAVVDGVTGDTEPDRVVDIHLVALVHSCHTLVLEYQLVGIGNDRGDHLRVILHNHCEVADHSHDHNLTGSLQHLMHPHIDPDGHCSRTLDHHDHVHDHSLDLFRVHFPNPDLVHP
eukprot:m.237001 g.237001  ORF g.237001 m.237001 type:complete len:153 (+) comp15267_c1_seq4:4525-4983(+)